MNEKKEEIKAQEKDLRKEISRVIADIAIRAKNIKCETFGDVGDLAYILTELEQI